jgi:hypothetical protein
MKVLDKEPTYRMHKQKQYILACKHYNYQNYVKISGSFRELNRD